MSYRTVEYSWWLTVIKVSDVNMFILTDLLNFTRVMEKANLKMSQLCAVVWVNSTWITIYIKFGFWFSASGVRWCWSHFSHRSHPPPQKKRKYVYSHNAENVKLKQTVHFNNTLKIYKYKLDRREKKSIKIRLFCDLSWPQFSRKLQHYFA